MVFVHQVLLNFFFQNLQGWPFPLVTMWGPRSPLLIPRFQQSDAGTLSLNQWGKHKQGRPSFHPY